MARCWEAQGHPLCDLAAHSRSRSAGGGPPMQHERTDGGDEMGGSLGSGRSSPACHIIGAGAVGGVLGSGRSSLACHNDDRRDGWRAGVRAFQPSAPSYWCRRTVWRAEIWALQLSRHQ